MNNTVIRKLRSDDAAGIGRIASSITGKHNRADLQRIIDKQTDNENEANFVAEKDDKLIGYCISYMLPGGFGIEKGAWVATVGVDPNFMGQGAGEMLVKEVFEHYKARGITNIYTSVRWDFTDMLSFFKTLGFQRSDFINLQRSIE